MKALRRLLLSALSVFSAVLLGHLVDLDGRHRLFERSQGDPRALAALLIERFPPHRCPPDRAQPQDDFGVLMRAFEVVERFATPRLERLAEQLIVRGTALTGLPAPALSLGEEQIRVGTAAKALQAFALAPDVRPINRNDLALQLLVPCRSHAIGVSVLRWTARELRLSTDAPSRAAILAIAAAYNGQGESRRLADFAAHRMYAEVVYHVYHALRFAALQEEAAHPGK